MNRRWLAALLTALMIGLLLPASVLADPPVADDDTKTVAEDANPTTIDVLANDDDIDLDTITIQSATNPDHGTVVIAGNDLSLTYEPDPNYHGSDSFDYVVVADGETDTATVDVTVTSVNDDPVAGGDSEGIVEDVTEAIDVLADDDDVDGDTLQVIAVGGSQSKGTASVSNGGDDVTYDPDQNATGADSFTYTVSDGNGGQDTATVSITISAVNDPPHADDDSATVTEDTPEDIDVLANDEDPDTALAIDSVTQGTKGSVTNHGDDVTYVPALNATGSDSFTYTLEGSGPDLTATVSITITASNDGPTAAGDAFTIDEDITTDFDVLDNDSDVDDTPTISDPGNPTHGSVAVVGGEIRYDPDQDYHGPDSFTYTITDGDLTDTALVSVTVDSVNDAPIADDDDVGVPEEAPATSLLVLSGDTDPDGDTLLITAKTNGTKGVVVITGGGTGLTYRPNANAFGADSFTYTISDGDLTDTATVTVDIGGANDPPNAVNDASMTVPQGAGPRPLAVLANDSDPDADTLTITSKTNGAHGTVTITGGGTGISYNPAGLYKGTDTFKYTVSDGHGGTDTATVLVTVVEDTVDPVVAAPTEVFPGQTAGRSTTKIRLSWSATDTGGTGVASYKLQVSVNGGAFATITSATTKTTWERLLTTGKSYRFRVRATDKEGNVSHYSYGPTLHPTRYSEGPSSKVAFVGSWPVKSTSHALGGKTRYSGTSTSRAVFTFTGYDVGWIATRYTSSGKAEVYVDGVLINTVDLDRSSTAYRRLVFQSHFATLATHTLEIRPVGDGRVDIDGFVVNR